MNDRELLESMVCRLGSELEGILQQLQRGELRVEVLEWVLRDRLWHVGAQALGVMLEALDGQLAAGRRVHDHRTRTIVSLFGPLDVARSRCDGPDGQVCPLDRAIGLDGQRGWTAGVQEAASLLSCDSSFETVADELDRLLGLSISPRTVQQLAEDAGRRAAAIPAVSPPARAPDTLIVAVDGCLAPQRDGWREVKLATLYPQASRVRTAGGRGRLRTKEYVGTLDDARRFGERLYRHAERWDVEHVPRVVVMGDGAPWIWHLAEMHFPDAVEIVDFYHAAEHLWEVGEALWGDRQTSVRTRSWVRRYRRYLRDGRVDLVIGAIDRSRHQQDAVLSAERRATVRLNRAYFERNAWRMRYSRFRQMGLPIGTGAVEGACKHVVRSRFKRAGMRWSDPGLRSMLALRLLRLNDRWEQLWPHHKAA